MRDAERRRRCVADLRRESKSESDRRQGNAPRIGGPRTSSAGRSGWPAGLVVIESQLPLASPENHVSAL